jgi:hypothetical protein
VETFSTGRERDRNENIETVRGWPGRDRHHRGSLLAATAGGASAGGSPAFVGPLHQTSVLASTVQGTGTTIVEVTPSGHRWTSATINPATVAANGKTVDGGTVIRLVVKIPHFGLPYIWSDRTIGSGFPEALNSSALVVGPTGAGLGANGTLYVADTLASRIAAIPNALFRGFSAGRGFTVSRGGNLNNELGLVIAGSTNPGHRPGRAHCSAWPSSPATTPSTTWTTPPTR